MHFHRMQTVGSNNNAHWIYIFECEWKNWFSFKGNSIFICTCPFYTSAATTEKSMQCYIIYKIIYIGDQRWCILTGSQRCWIVYLWRMCFFVHCTMPFRIVEYLRKRSKANNKTLQHWLFLKHATCCFLLLLEKFFRI